MNQMQIDTVTFIKASQFPVMADKPATWIDQQTKDLCYKLIEEEVVKELLPAIENDDWEGIIDGACDALYVIFFLCSKINIDIQPFYDLVQKANMDKMGGPIHPETGKQLKPEGWQPPDIAGLLERIKAKYE